jgi:hypothetical protein
VLLSSAIYTGLGLLFVSVYYKRLIRGFAASAPEDAGKAQKDAAAAAGSDIQAGIRETGMFLPIGISMILLLGLVVVNYLYMAGVIA